MRLLLVSPPVAISTVNRVSGAVGVDPGNILGSFVMTEDPSGNSGVFVINTTPAMLASYQLKGLRAQVFYITSTGIEAGNAVDL